MMTRMFHDIRLPLLGFGAMRLPLLADGSGRVGGGGENLGTMLCAYCNREGKWL